MSEESTGVKAKPLNARQMLFCRHYAEGMTIGKAYMEVYKCKNLPSASVGGTNLLKKTNIVEEVERQQSIMDVEVIRIKRINTFKAIQKQTQLIDDSTPTVMAMMVKDALDRGGHKPKEQVEHSGEIGVNVAFFFGDKLIEDDL